MILPNYQRYILREILAPFGIGLLIFTFVLLIGRMLKLMELVVNRGVSPVDIGVLITTLMPTFLALTLPLAFLLAVMIGFGRLSADAEAIAMKASGISLFRMFRPVLLLALLVALLTGALSTYVAPASNAAFRQKLFDIARKRADVVLQPRVFIKDYENLVFYANQIDARRGSMSGVFIVESRTDDQPVVILAKHGQMISDQTTSSLLLRLHDGTIHRTTGEQPRQNYSLLNFKTYDINLRVDPELKPSEGPFRKVADLDLSELLATLSRDDLPRPMEQRLRVGLHKRLTLAIAPLIFALLATPLGMQSNRSGRSGGFTIGLLIFLGYYLLMTFMETLAVELYWPVIACFWLPTLLLAAAGLWLLRQAALERPSLLIARLDSLILALMRRRSPQ